MKAICSECHKTYEERKEEIFFLIGEVDMICYECANKYQPERSKREDFSCTVITNKEIEDEMKKMPQFKTYSELERCGALNSMET